MINVLFFGIGIDISNMLHVLEGLNHQILSEINDNFVSIPATRTIDSVVEHDQHKYPVMVLLKAFEQPCNINVNQLKEKLSHTIIIDGRWDHPKITANALTGVIEGIRAAVPRKAPKAGELILFPDCDYVKQAGVAF